MAKKRTDTTEDAQRQSRKDLLMARRQARQTRQIRLAMGAVGALLVLVFIVAIVNELLIAPDRAVAVVAGQKIPLREWQDRVRYERAQRIILLENQLEAFGGDVGIIQQFAGQMIIDLQDAQSLAQGVLDQMVSEEMTRQLAEARGITVTDADIDEAIEESFNYFDGASPTAVPSPTSTVMPTPSLTPVPTAVITDVLPTATLFPTPTTGPTATPRPTATPVSAEAYEERLGELVGQLEGYEVDQETYRAVVRAQLYRERFIEALAVENELPSEAMQASIFFISFDAEEDANEAHALIEEGLDFLSLWNTLRTAPSELEVAGTASELLWRSQEDLASSLGDAAAEAAFNLELNVPSEVIIQDPEAETSRYFLIQVSGREIRPLSDSALEQDKFELYTNFIDQQLITNLESNDFWLSRVPTVPVLDPKFLAPPTPTPVAPLVVGTETPVPATPEGS